VPRKPTVPRVPGEPIVPTVPGVPRVPRVPRVPKVPKVPIAPPPPPPLRGASDKEKRKAIKKAEGAIAFNMGEVGAKSIRKRVWHTLLSPFTQEDYVTVVGKAPRGARILVEGENSAYRTAQLLYGKAPSRKISMDIGFMDATISARGKKINLKFTPDPKGLTTGEITTKGILSRTPPITAKLRPITEELPPITNRRRGLGGGRSFRITPKTPALRR